MYVHGLSFLPIYKLIWRLISETLFISHDIDW